jgi:hypothetical protein
VQLDNGQLIGKYGQSRSFRIVLYGLALLFAAVGVFGLFLGMQAASGALRFDGDISILYKAGAGSIGVALLIALVTWRLTSSQPTFYLYENAIHAAGPKVDRVDRYEDIEDLFSFFWGGLGYRANPKAPWTFIAANRISKYAQLRDYFTELHVEKRGPLLLNRLAAGETIRFRCVPEQVALSKSMVASRDMNFETYDLELNARSLKIKDKIIDVQRIGEFRGNLWTERCQIIDIDGRLWHSLHLTAIMSPKVLLFLIVNLQGRH